MPFGKTNLPQRILDRVIGFRWGFINLTKLNYNQSVVSVIKGFEKLGLQAVVYVLIGGIFLENKFQGDN